MAGVVDREEEEEKTAERWVVAVNAASKALSQRWLRIAEVIAEFNSRVVLTLFYAIIVLPFGLVVRLFADPLAIRKTRISAWSEIRHRTRTLDEGKRQF